MTAARTNDAPDRPEIGTLEWWREQSPCLIGGVVCDHTGTAHTCSKKVEAAFAHLHTEIASLRRQIEEARADEREKCAQNVDGDAHRYDSEMRSYAQYFAARIRARKDDAP